MQMQTDRLEAIAEWLENPETKPGVKFNMNTGLEFGGDNPECGTVCCIAGAAVLMFSTPKDLQAITRKGYAGLSYAWWYEVADAARELLGITENLSDSLFQPMHDDNPVHDHIDAAWAARTVRHLIATGEVDWEATRES